MDTPLPLRTVMDAVAEAVAGARSRLDAAQCADLDAFLEDDGRPRAISIRPRADSDQIIDVPLLVISPPTVLQIVEASVEFEVDPAELAGVLASGGETTVAGLRVVASGLGPTRARLEFAPLPGEGRARTAHPEPEDASSGAPLVDLLSAPFLTAHAARVRMARESLDYLLSTGFDPTPDGRALVPRMISLNLTGPVPGAPPGPDGAFPTTQVAFHLPIMAAAVQSEPGIKDMSLTCVFEVLSVSPPSGLSGVVHLPDAPPPDAAAPLLHIALKAVDTGVAPNVAEQVDRLMEALPRP